MNQVTWRDLQKAAPDVAAAVEKEGVILDEEIAPGVVVHYGSEGERKRMMLDDFIGAQRRKESARAARKRAKKSRRRNR